MPLPLAQTDQSSLSQTAVRLRTMAVMVLEFVLFGTMTLLAAVVARSTIGAAVVGQIAGQWWAASPRD